MKVNLTLPVHNEEPILESSVERLIPVVEGFLSGCCEIVIAENGSTDRTFEVGCTLAKKHRQVTCIQIIGHGRGRALKEAWTRSNAEVLSYMDIDLSTDPKEYSLLIEPLLRGEFEVAVGSRLLRPEWTTRGAKRETISRTYNGLIRLLFQTGFSDAQCGFKAISRKAADVLIPQVVDNGWFFDTELLLLAERLNFRILDLPVHWKDDPDSRVRIPSTAIKDLKGLLRMRRRFCGGFSGPREAP